MTSPQPMPSDIANLKLGLKITTNKPDNSRHLWQ